MFNMLNYLEVNEAISLITDMGHSWDDFCFNGE